MPTYLVHGLTIATDILFPELTPGGGTPDVVVRLGDVPSTLEAPGRSGRYFQASRDTYLLSVPGIARFLASRGREVTIEIEPDAPPGDVRTYFLGTVLTALLHQRGVLVLHAGALLGRGGAVVVGGESGQGKSTILAAAVHAGFRLLADDAAAITPGADGALWLHPGYPVLRVWKDTLLRFGMNPALVERTRAGIDKFGWPVGESFVASQQTVAAVFVLEKGDVPRVEVHRVTGSEAFALVHAQTRNLVVLEGLEMQPAHFMLAARLADAVPIWRIRRPPAGDTIEEIIAVLRPSLS